MVELGDFFFICGSSLHSGDFEYPVYIFPDHIEFNIHLIARLKESKIGMFKGIGDDGYAETFTSNIKGGKAYPVNADGTLFDHQRCKLCLELEIIFPASAFIGDLGNGGGGINMALDQVAVEPAVHDHGTFQVNYITMFPLPGIGLGKGFFHSGDLVLIAMDGFHGKADTAMGQALVHAEFMDKGSRQQETPVATGFGDVGYLAKAFNNACKHGVNLTEFRQRKLKNRTVFEN